MSSIVDEAVSRARRLLQRAKSSDTPTWIFALAMAASCCIALYHAFRRAFDSDIYGLAASIQDDSFYYLLPAFHFTGASPGVFTFDGVNPTYGFQPLYMLVLAALGLLHSDLETFLSSAVFLNAALHCVAAVFIYLAIGRALSGAEPLVARFWSAIGGTFYLCHATLFLSNTTVKENAAAAALLGIVLWICLGLANETRSEEARHRPAPAAGLLGALIGLLVLCRILPTTLLIVFVLVVWVLWRTDGRLRFVASLSIPLAVWGAFALLSFGQLMPTSGTQKALSVAELPALIAQPGVVSEMRTLLGFYLRDVALFTANQHSGFYLPQMDSAAFGADGAIVDPQVHSWLALLLFGSAALSLLLPGLRSLLGSAALRLLVALLAANAIGYVATVVLLWPSRGDLFYFTWYIYASPVLATIAAATAAGMLGQAGYRWMVERLESASAVRKRLEGAASVVVAVVLIAGAGIVFGRLRPLGPLDPGVHRWQSAMIRAGLYLRDEAEIGPADRVGAWNSGALGFVLPGRVVNMDGLANEAVLAYRRKRWAKFADAFGITYYADVKDPAVLDVEVERLTTFPTGHPSHPTLHVARVRPDRRE